MAKYGQVPKSVGLFISLTPDYTIMVLTFIYPAKICKNKITVSASFFFFFSFWTIHSQNGWVQLVHVERVNFLM